MAAVPSGLLLAVLALLWMQLAVALMPVWGAGTYYDYGWYVVPIGGYFFWRRWQLVREPSPRVAGPQGFKEVEGGSVVRPWYWALATVGAMLLAAVLWGCRVSFADSPGWRLPVWLHALTVAGLHHGLLAHYRGWRASLFLVPATILVLTAVPYPMRVEGPLLHHLAEWVAVTTREILLLLGRPVSVMGERLTLDGQQVAVSNGCSGLRSFQSLIMAGWFFGELFWLSWARRLILLAVAAGAAIFTNTGRACWLAWTQFTQGTEALQRSHDWAGHIAFGIGCLLLLAGALALRPRTPAVMTRRRVGSPLAQGSTEDGPMIKRAGRVGD